jgi:hypothetical protein
MRDDDARPQQHELVQKLKLGGGMGRLQGNGIYPLACSSKNGTRMVSVVEARSSE